MNPNTQKKAEWLEELERQSWQAELLISGLIIVSLFGLPDQIIHWIENWIVQSSETSFSVIFLCLLYFLVGVYLVICSFVIHFSIRSLWIALLGLNSVYPQGIQKKPYGAYTEKMMEWMQLELGDINGFCERLDRIGSLMFSISAVIIMMYLWISILVGFLGFIAYLICLILPSFRDHLTLFLLVIILMISLIQIALGLLKSYWKKTEERQFFYYKFSQINQKILLGFFYKPVTQILNIIITNVKFNYVFYTICIVIGSMIMAGGVSNKIEKSSILFYFSPKNYFRFNNLASQQFSYNYNNLRPENKIIFTPCIASDIVKGESLQLFLPIIYREEVARERLYAPIETEDLTKEEIKAQEITQHQKFNAIKINDQTYEDLVFRFYQHPNQSEEGILTYISTKDFKIGENILEINKAYYNKDSIPKRVLIPFYFEGRN